MGTDVEGGWHFAKRKTSGTWINTGMFTQIWKKIAEAGEYQNADWVMKLDADAIFIANRMRVWLKQNELVPPAGIYLENCKYVDYGYFGNLEVYSTQAFSTLVQNIDSCKQTLNWKVGVKDGKYGPMGEDLFAQSCLDSVGIRRKEACDITTDGACPANRPKAERRTRSGSQIAHMRPLQRCTPSRRHRSGSSATKPPQPPSGHNWTRLGLGPLLTFFPDLVSVLF